MTYASQSRRPNPAALAGAIGIPAAVAALLVVGLAVTVVIEDKPKPLTGFTVKPIPIPPPPPDPVEPVTTTNQQPQTSTTTTITRPDTIPVDLGSNTPIQTLPGAGELTGPISVPVDFGIPGPAPSASPFDPVAASPRGNPGRWVTDSDYRSRWIREGLSGKAGFTLAIDAAGKVTGCTITRSTGHKALDEATCELVSKRARFVAARDGTGKPVAGSYSNTVNWQIPK
ncbi:energy transducer TonB [Erythrobacter dokdonensis]|uniref:Outer membrane transport energization protein TonB n=1 Tax=Erythrobacter dokdonensis DSW-74 TaxID=1300349 RepID=A0A1A7BFW4_9SPHN|nr:energy transducer TonB [Erythrobacter dokdonensis]OBV11423.1 Outer membrane transport energization protein TonB [Erythrobacter dokdonensis DSW-74]